MHFNAWIKFYRCGRSLGERPEQSTFLSLLVNWINVQKLLHIIEEVLLETQASESKTVFKGLRLLFNHLYNLFQSSLFLLVRIINRTVFLLNNKFIETLRL